MNPRALLVGAVLAGAAVVAWRWLQHRQFRGALGERAYSSLDALLPAIDHAPQIRVPMPRLQL